MGSEVSFGQHRDSRPRSTPRGAGLYPRILSMLMLAWSHGRLSIGKLWPAGHRRGLAPRCPRTRQNPPASRSERAHVLSACVLRPQVSALSWPVAASPIRSLSISAAALAAWRSPLWSLGCAAARPVVASSAFRRPPPAFRAKFRSSCRRHSSYAADLQALQPLLHAPDISRRARGRFHALGVRAGGRPSWRRPPTPCFPRIPQARAALP